MLAPCPAYVLPSLRPGGPALRRSPKLTRTWSWPACSRESCWGRCWSRRPPQVPYNLHTWVGYSAFVCLLKHLNSDLLPARKDAGTRNDPKLNPPSGFIPKQQLAPSEPPVVTQSEERKDHFIVDISWGGSGVTALQLMNTNQHLQQQSHRALRKPGRQKEAGFCSLWESSPSAERATVELSPGTSRGQQSRDSLCSQAPCPA